MNPVLIGAGIGALGSAVQGKSPLTGALLGGATGGLFGGSESLLGGKIASAFGQGAVGGVSNGITAATGELAKQAIPSVGIQGLGQNVGQNLATGAVGSLDDIAGSWAIGKGALPATTTTGAYAGGIPVSAGDLTRGVTGTTSTGAYQIPLESINTSKLFNYTDPTMMDKIQGFGNDAFSFAKNNPVTTGGYALKGIEAMNAPPEKVNTSAQRPVTQGQFQGYTPTAAASRVAPQIVPVPINKTGMLQLDTVVAQNPELRKLYPDLFGG
jgi:hypothetical protein